MAKTLTEYITRITIILQDDAEVIVGGSNTELKALIRDSVSLIYDRDRPAREKHDYTGDGSAYEFALPTNWVEGFSVIKTVEYPAGEQDPTYLPPENYEVYLKVDGTKKIRLFFDTPGTTDHLYVEYIKPHNIPDTDPVTMSDGDFEAICHLVAGVTLLSMANKYGQSSDPVIGTDVVDYKAKADRYVDLSKKQFDLYLKSLQEDGGTEASLIMKEVDTTLAYGGRLLTHSFYDR